MNKRNLLKSKMKKLMNNKSLMNCCLVKIKFKKLKMINNNRRFYSSKHMIIYYNKRMSKRFKKCNLLIIWC